MKIAAVLIAVLSAVAGTALADSSRAIPELSLGGISVGQTESSVIHTLGPPRYRTKLAKNAELPIQLGYDGLLVTLDKGGVIGLTSTSNRHCTPSKVCPGMTVARVDKIYGPAAPPTDGVHFEYFGADECWFRMEVRRRFVKAIEIACQPPGT